VNLALTDDQALLARTVREFAEAEIRPHVMEWDEAQHFPEDTLLPKLAGLGLTGIQIDERYGGAGMGAVDYCICIEELARVCPGIALTVAAHNGLSVAHLNMFGSESQKERWLVPLARGEYLGAWGLTEAAAGSDAAAMRTVARSDGDGWVINGAKQFITHGRIGRVIVVMAVTDRSKGHRGITAFVVERGTPGMSPGKKENSAAGSSATRLPWRTARCRRRWIPTFASSTARNSRRCCAPQRPICSDRPIGCCGSPRR
jgi:hypothetical protein